MELSLMEVPEENQWNPFVGCTRLTKIHVDPNHPVLGTINAAYAPAQFFEKFD